jgi:circadian clock protein KaiB
MAGGRPALQLYVAGDGIGTRKARETLQRLCNEQLRPGYELEVIDVLEEPERAEAASILATPTVVRASPLPELRVVGDLGDERAVRAALEIGGEAAG